MDNIYLSYNNKYSVSLNNLDGIEYLFDTKSINLYFSVKNKHNYKITNYQEFINTLREAITPFLFNGISSLPKYNKILLLDDILVTGTSLSAMEHVLIDYGGNIYYNKKVIFLDKDTNGKFNK